MGYNESCSSSAMRTEISLHRRGAVTLGLACAAAALVAGALLAFGGPVLALAMLLALGAALWLLRDLNFGFWAVIGIITLLPFAAFPFKLVFIPTFLDAALGGLLILWVLQTAGRGQWAGGRGQRRGSDELAIGLPWGVAAFGALAVFAFIAGFSHAPLTANVLRHFVELLMSIALFFVVVDMVRDHASLERLVRALILGGTLAAALGIVLYALPEDTANLLLNGLRPLGYPTGDVLRFIEDNPDLPERAIGTSVDPNVLGGLLIVTLSLALPQLTTSQPLMPRRWTALAVGLMAVCLILTFSRGALAGVVAAALGLALIRYRRLLPLLLVATALLLLLPATQDYVAHLVAGLQGQDLATQMRFGEYQDALTLIGRYPIFGVGFASAPDLDLYLGVSNVYLLMAEEMGLLGLAAFLALVIALFAAAWRVRSAALADPRLEPTWLGLHMALAGALVGGLFDHYFFNLDFHHAITLFWLIVGLAVAATRLANRQ